MRREAGWIGAVSLDANIWYDRAAEARAIARRIEDPESSRLLARIAEIYDGLNERANELLDHSKSNRVT